MFQCVSPGAVCSLVDVLERLEFVRVELATQLALLSDPVEAVHDLVEKTIVCQNPTPTPSELPCRAPTIGSDSSMRRVRSPAKWWVIRLCGCYQTSDVGKFAQLGADFDTDRPLPLSVVIYRLGDEHNPATCGKQDPQFDGNKRPQKKQSERRRRKRV